MKILLLAPPRRFWPFISDNDNFILPQNLPCLASPLVKEGFSVRIIDCLPLKMGWSSLESFLKDYRPDVVGIGENHALYCDEVLKAFALCKKIDPAVVTVAGGTHFSSLADDYIDTQNIDFIVVGEGEITLLELARHIASGGRDYAKINGLVFKDSWRKIHTQPRALVEDLDSLPMPAYDLLPIEKYGRSRYLFYPGGISIHHGRE